MAPDEQVDLRRRSANADFLGRYYTPETVGQTLITAMPQVRPKLIVELGAGKGELASAASRRWSKAQLITVDSDKSSASALRHLRARTQHTHHTHDALDEALAERIGVRLGSVDVGLCNPPYVRPRWRTGFGQILEDAGFSNALQSMYDAGADLLFVAQNLRLLKPHGKLGLILPDGLITGERYRGVRKVLLGQHLVEQVVQLPSRIFAGTEAQTYLLVLSKRSGETQAVSLRKMDPLGQLSESISVPADRACGRLDYTYHSTTRKNAPRTKRKGSPTLASLIQSISRGTVSSNQVGLTKCPTFHLGNFPTVSSRKEKPAPGARFIVSRKRAVESGQRFATEGDVLIARVGRNLQDKVCAVRRGVCVVSDCIFILHPYPGKQAQLLDFLISRKGRTALAASAHGVGAKYLTRADILEIAL